MTSPPPPHDPITHLDWPLPAPDRPDASLVSLLHAYAVRAGIAPARIAETAGALVWLLGDRASRWERARYRITLPYRTSLGEQFDETLADVVVRETSFRQSLTQPYPTDSQIRLAVTKFCGSALSRQHWDPLAGIGELGE